MTPKEKAKELYNKFKVFDFDIYRGWTLDNKETKIHSLIYVEEILNVTHSDKRANSPLDKEWWHKVKTEIEKL